MTKVVVSDAISAATTNLSATGAAIVLGVLGWTIYVRRGTWKYRWDYALTLTAVLDTVGLLFCLPTPGRYIGNALHSATHIYNLSDYIGHLCFLGAIGWTIYALCCRLVPDDQIRKLMLRAEIPAALSAAIMLIALVGTHAPPSDNFFARHVGPWLAVYWLTFAATVTYLLLWNARLMWIMRSDPRSKTSATCSLIAIGLGICCVIARVTGTIDATVASPAADLTWIFLCAAITVGCAGAAWSWLRRMHIQITPADEDIDRRVS